MFATYPMIEVVVRTVSLIAAWLIGSWVFCWLSLILHEFGHYAVGSLAGLPVAEVRLGSGRIWRIFQWGHTRLIVHRRPLSGWVAPHRAGNRLQQAVMILGGPLATAAFACVLWCLVWFPPNVPHSRAFAEFMNLFRIFAMMETAGLLITLWPAWYQIYGQRVRNDGLLLWNLFFPGEVPKSPPGYDGVARALSAGEKEGAVRLAREAAQACESKDYDHHQELLAGTLLAAGQVEAAAGIYRDQLGTMKPAHPKFPQFADSLACIALYEHVPPLFDEAEKWIRRALEAHPQAHTLKGTLGALLAEKGADAEALPLLRELYARAETETDLGISAAYLTVLATRRGAETEAARYRQQARTALPEHPLVQRVLGRGIGDVADIADKAI